MVRACVFFCGPLEDLTRLHACKMFDVFPRFSVFSLAIPLQDRSIHLTYSYPYIQIHIKMSQQIFVEACVYVYISACA